MTESVVRDTGPVRMNTARLLWRQYGSDRGAAWTVMVVVFLLALATALAPRALDGMYTRDLHASVADTPAALRDLSSVNPLAPPLSDGADPWSAMSASLAAMRDQGDPLVREALGDGQYLSYTQDFTLERGDADAELTSFIVGDPFVAGLVDIVEGTAPAPLTDAAAGAVIDVMLSRENATALSWEVGEERAVGEPVPEGTVRLRLSGIYEPRDAAAGAWDHHRASIVPDVSDDFDRGLRYSAAAYADPSSFAAVLDLFFGVASTRVWLPVDASGVAGADAAALRDGLAAFGSLVYPVGGSGAAGQPYRTVDEVRFTTETVAVLDTVVQRRVGSSAVLAIVAAGPIGVAIAVMTLVARLLIERRRSALALTSARGASPAQFRLWLGLEGLAISLPGALAAWIVAALMIPGPASALGIVLPALVGLAPAVLLPIAGRPNGLRTVRRDIGLERPSAARRFVEVLVVVAAIASCVALNMRGLDAGPGVDPLLAATPLLVAFAVTMVVMRLYPAPVAAIGRRLRRSRSTVAYLGTARATRDPAGGLVPMLALVVGLSIAAFSVVMWSTTENGLDETAWHEVGADARLVGSPPTEDEMDAAASVAGVEAVIPVSTPGPMRFQNGPEITRFALTVTDLGAVAALEADRGGTSSVPTDIVGLTADGAVPIATSSDGPEIGTAGQLSFGARRVDAVVVDHVDEVPGLNPTGASWILADRDTVMDAGISSPAFRTVLLDAAEGATPDLDAVVEALGSNGTVTTPDDVAAALRGPVNAGTTVAIIAAIALTGLLCAASVVLTLVVSAPSRGRLLAQLRTLGLTGRQGEGLVAWETAPVAIASLGAGLLLGVTLPWLILGGVDLTALTGGRAQPSIVVPYGLLLVLLVAFVAVVAVAVGGSVLAGRRFRPASVLRVGDE